MFESTRLKLTAWYLLIIMVISVFFSAIIFFEINQELDRFDRLQQVRRERLEQIMQSFPAALPLPQYDPALLVEARKRLLIILGLINLGILLLAGGAGYFLAGRTLRPIRVMIDEQDRFITDASHELRTPLTSLRSEIEVNLRDKKLAIADAKKLLASNLEEVVKLQTLSDSLIDLTSYRNHNDTHSFQQLSLLKTIEAALKRVSPLASRKHIAIENTIEETTLVGNAHMLCEVFVILLDNAIKYSSKRTIITLRSKKKEHMLFISVTDQGVGIEENDLVHIFDRFYRVDTSRTTTTVAGYGLGLAIAKKFITQHKGSMQVKSQLNKGTTFTVQLPIKLAA